MEEGRGAKNSCFPIFTRPLKTPDTSLTNLFSNQEIPHNHAFLTSQIIQTSNLIKFYKNKILILYNLALDLKIDSQEPLNWRGRRAQWEKSVENVQYTKAL